MFRVRHIGTDREYTVYAVSGTKFLIFIYGDLPRWEYREMQDFEPVEEW